MPSKKEERMHEFLPTADDDIKALADEMGLGKTVQALAFLATTSAYPAVLVVPPHLIRNWQRELARFLSPAAIRKFCIKLINAVS